MTAFTRRRLDRLQAKREASGACEECGYPSSEAATYELVFVDPALEATLAESENDSRCSACGRQTSVDIWFPQDRWTPRK
jgi:ribosomal protein L37E